MRPRVSTPLIATTALYDKSTVKSRRVVLDRFPALRITIMLIVYLARNRAFLVNVLALALVGGTLLVNLSHQTSVSLRTLPVTAMIEPPAPPMPPELPFGGYELFPGYRFVALYGTPSVPALGALGEQNLSKTITRVKKLAKAYQASSKEPVIPTLEIIASIASANPTKDNDYSQEIESNVLMGWIDAAKAAGLYVVLDLQPGRDDFLTQAKQYEELLEEPHVGLALDPEWRLKSNQVHLKQIGTVDAKEVNRVSSWLASLTKKHQLPQKLFLLHYFKESMITNRAKLNTKHVELGYVIQMDGHGSPGSKDGTWRNLTKDPINNMRFGWKNFYDEDPVLRSPDDTMKVKPKPWFVSYQ